MKITCAIDDIKFLKAAELKAILDGDHRGEYLLVDVRQPEEYAAGHIPEAFLIPLGEIEYRQAELDRKKKIITYCRSGRRSLSAAIVLCENGFTKLHHLENGMMEWPYDSISGIPKPTRQFVSEVTDLTDILQLAMRMEKGVSDFYQAAFNKPNLAKVKSMIEILQKAEEEHIHRLYDRLSVTVNKDRLPTFDKLVKDIKDNYMEGGIEINLALTEWEKMFSSELDVLEAGLEKEYRAYDFYKRAEVLVIDVHSKSLLHELAQEERSHANALLDRLAQFVKGIG